MFDKDNKLTMDISDKEIIEILQKYYSNKFGSEVKVESKLGIKYVNTVDGCIVSRPDIEFYIFDKNGNQSITSPLTKYDIKEALNDYVSSLGYSFESFKYIGGIRHIGQFIDDDTPYFEGIKVYYREKSMHKKLVL